jgi:hypothetical protein
MFENLKMQNASKSRGRPANPKYVKASPPPVVIDKKFELTEMFKKLRSNDLGSVWEILAMNDPDLQYKNEIELDLDKLPKHLLDELYAYTKNKIAGYATTPHPAPQNHPENPTKLLQQDLTMAENKGSTKDETQLSNASSDHNAHPPAHDAQGQIDSFVAIQNEQDTNHQNFDIGTEDPSDDGMDVPVLTHRIDPKNRINQNSIGNPSFGFLGKRQPGVGHEYESDLMRNASGISGYCDFDGDGRKM